MAFMNPDITDKQAWLQADGGQGVESVPLWVVGIDEETAKELIEQWEETNEIPAEFADYVQSDKLFALEIVQGFGARLSAPGYMDCTEWCVFDSPEEAEDYLAEAYGEDDDDDSEV